jgi:hypothetical protein
MRASGAGIRAGTHPLKQRQVLVAQIAVHAERAELGREDRKARSPPLASSRVAAGDFTVTL